MKPVRIDQEIHASPEAVFNVMAHIDNFRNAVDDIVEVEFLSDSRRGLGTVFRETRKMGKRKATVEMEVVEYQPPHTLRIVSRPDPMGTVWDSRFVLTKEGACTKLSLEMTANSKNLFTRFMNTLFAGMIQKAVAKDMASLKAYCEKAS